MKNESGRSMVEMLGVLAIIGVLSAGALSGYSQAMKKHRYNTFMNQIVRLQQAICEKFTDKQIDKELTNADLIPMGIFDGFQTDPSAEECEGYSRCTSGTVKSAVNGYIVTTIRKSDKTSSNYVLEIDFGYGRQAEELCLWFIKNYSWDSIVSIDTTSGFNKWLLINDEENYIPDMCHYCAYDENQGCWFETCWNF